MDNYAIVRPEHLNHHGNLFGGAVLKWVDEYAWLAASLDYSHCRLVTVAMDKVVFRQPTCSGAILRFHIRRLRQGTTSVTYQVDIHADEPGADVEKHILTTQVTFVSIDSRGRKKALPKKTRVRSDGPAPPAGPAPSARAIRE